MLRIRGGVNVAYNKRKIIKNIAESEPFGRDMMDVANDTKLHKDTVSTLCYQLEEDDYIFRKNKQARYHVTYKIYSYPILTAFYFGTNATRSIR